MTGPSVSPDVVLVDCLDCRGTGIRPTFFNRLADCWEDEPCRACDETGAVPLEEWFVQGGAA